MKDVFLQIAGAFRFLPDNLLLSPARKACLFPVYHAVSDDELIHIKHLYPIKSVKQFERDLDFFLMNFTPVDPLELVNSLKQGKFRENTFVLTFDDGLRQFYDVIAPILLKKGLPAICFLNTAFIGNTGLFYRYKAGILKEVFNERNISNATISSIHKLITSYNLHFDHDGKFLLSISYENRSAMDEIAILLDVDFESYLKHEKPYLDAEQIRTLSGKGFIFGSHSVDHPVFSSLNTEDQLAQIKESTDYVWQNFSPPVRLFSFPFTDFGVRQEFFDRVLNSQPPLADFTFGCAGLKYDMIARNIQRIPMEERGLPAQDIMRGETLYFRMKSVIGKNTIQRS
ncbi:MAG TPA: polysaccharide deacetylase family protein [Bacteroidales bacterium]|nr:polysaccharide deacetylase family protein [Bacteroidales bacterium]